MIVASLAPLRGHVCAARKHCHGLASLMAMLFLVLFSTLAIGFYASSTMSAQVATNDKALSRADAAADGGMQFVRYQLGQITVPPTVQTSGIMDAVAQQLATQLNGSANMKGHSVANQNGTIYVPASNDWMMLDSTLGMQFRAIITQSGQFLVVTVEGCGVNTSLKKAIRVQFQKAPRAGAILDYGVASQGTITTGGAATITGATDPTKGSVLSADMTSPTPVIIGGPMVSGDISMTNPAATAVIGAGTSVGGTSNPLQIPQHIHSGITAPTFPVVDTSPFTAYATNAYVAGSSTLTNVYIPPNTNPKFTGGVTINGVLWIQSPNVVTFKGGVTINGVIVTDTTGAFDATNNQINFGGNVSATPVSALDPSVYGGLTKLTGSFLLAPNYAVSFTGNFGSISGSIVAGQVSMTGNASGTVSGSVIGLQDVPMTLNGSSSITISGTGTTNYPSGLNFGNFFTPLPGTYVEIVPP